MMDLNTFGDIAIADAVATAALPDLDGVVAEYWFGSAAGAPDLLNAITGGAATAIGAPAVTPGWAHFSYAANTGAVLDLALPYSATALPLIRPTAGEPIVMSPGDLSDYNFVFRGGSFEASAGQNGLYDGTPQAHLPTPSPANFTLFAGQYSSGLLTRLYRLDANGVAMADAAGGYSTNPLRDPTKPIQIGGRVNANLQGEFDLASAIVTADLRGEEWLRAAYVHLKPYAASRGVPVN